MVHSRALVVALAASVAFSLLLASTSSMANSDSDGDGVSDSVELATQRNVVASSAGDEFSISSHLLSAPFEDRFEVSYDAGTFDVFYERAGRSGSPGGSGFYQLEIRNLVEWNDLNQNKRLDAGDNVSKTPLGSSTFGNVPVNKTRTENADGGIVYSFLIRSRTDQVTLRLTVAQRFMRISSRVLTPMEVKLDITINHTFAQPSASLGIELRMDTEDRLEYGNRSWDDVNGFARNEAGINVTGGPPDAPATVFFSWSKSAFADGTEIPVTWTNYTTEPNSYEMYIAYPLSQLGEVHPRVTLVHDPVLGVDSAAYEGIVKRSPELQGDVVVYAVSLAGMALLVATTIVIANRRRKKGEE